MLQAALEGFAAFTPLMLVYIAVGVAIGSVVSVFPGLGGNFALVILIPLAYTLEPSHAIAMLIAAAVVSGTANTITAVLFGVPGSAAGVTILFDGYPLAKQGQGSRAVAAGLVASLVGGILGAFFLALLLPVVRPITLALGPAEFAALIVLALFFISYVQESSTSKGLVSGGFGVLLAFVGMEPSTAELRWTFDSLYLFDGLSLVPVVVGFFAISEMISLTQEGGSIAKKGSIAQSSGGTLRGTLDVFKYWRTTVTSSIIGVVVGIIPGMGSAAAQFIAYGQAARTSKERDMFGKGAIEGVISGDAATNAKEGGSLIPTLAFGIPGSSSMAILLVAFLAFGIQPGPAMLTTNLSLTWTIIWILVLSNVMATLLSLAFSGQLAKLTFVPVAYLVPFILVVSVWGAYATNNHLGDIIVAMVFGILGYLMKIGGYARASFVIGFVLGEILESNYLLAQRLYGWSFLTRPITATILGLLVLSVMWPVAKKLLGRTKGSSDAAEKTSADDIDVRPGS